MHTVSKKDSKNVRENECKSTLMSFNPLFGTNSSSYNLVKAYLGRG